MILCGGLHLSHGEKLKCEFKDGTLYVGKLYYCYVTSLDNSLNSMTIDGFTGVHMAGRSDNDVKGIWIHDTNTKYIPSNLGFWLHLTALIVQKSNLIEIKAGNFQGMQNLEYLSLAYNKLTHVPSDAFSKMTKLKVIWLENNQIKYIGAGLFDKLINLNDVDLSVNICISKRYRYSTEIIQMKEDIKSNCLTSTEMMLIQIEKRIKNEMTSMRTERQQEHNEIRNHQVSLKKETDALVKDKESWKVDKEDLVKDKEALMKDKEAWKVDKDALMKDKESWKVDKKQW